MRERSEDIKELSIKKKLLILRTVLEDSLKDSRIQIIFIFSMIFLRYLFFGFEYYYQLDDYIQHHNYVLTTEYQWGETWATLERMGLLSYRPLAGILDLTLWSLLFEEMILGVALITVLYAVSALFFYKLFREIFSCSPLFLVIYTMIPLGFEGSYWMSASTRILPPLCCLSLALWFFHKFCKLGELKDFLWFFLFQCLSYCFYEQVLALSITAVVLLMVYHLIFFKSRRIRALSGCSFLLSALLYVLVTKYAPTSAMVASRTEFIFPSPYYYEVFLPDLLEQLKLSFLHGGFYTIYTGFFRGIAMIFQQSAYGYLLLSLFLPLGIVFFPKEERLEPKGNKNHKRLLSTEDKTKKLPSIVGFVVGFLLFLAPISMFFIIANPWFSLRGTVPSFCGIALMIDMVFRLCSGKYFFALGKVTAVVLSFLSLVASVSELSDYKATYDNDSAVISALYPFVSHYDSSVSVAVFGVEPSFLEEVNFQYHEHFHGVTESQWALSGALTTRKDETGAKLMPFSLESYAYYPYHGESKRPEQFQVFLYYHHDTGTVLPLTMEPIEEGVYDFFVEDGTFFGTLWESEGYGEIILSESFGLP